MKFLNERDKKMRTLAMQTLNVGDDVTTGMSKAQAKKFLKSIGLSDSKIKELEGKGGNVEESLNEEHIIKGINTDKEAQITLKNKGIMFNRIERVGDKIVYFFKKDSVNYEIGYLEPSKSILVLTDKNKIKESCGCSDSELDLNEGHCNCQMCPEEKHSKCNKSTKKQKKKMKDSEDMMGEEEIHDKINSVDSAQSTLKAKNIQWDKIEKMGNKTVWKKNNSIVGAWDPSWGTVRTGEDLLKD